MGGVASTLDATARITSIKESDIESKETIGLSKQVDNFAPKSKTHKTITSIQE